LSRSCRSISTTDPASQDRANNFEVVARLRSEVTIGQARGAMRIAADTLRPLIPGLVGDSETVGVRPLRERLYGKLRQPLSILLGSAAFVLLIGCVNVANLQLAQASGRRPEIALRTALAASTSALVRQLLVESLLLAAIGGAAGVAALALVLAAIGLYGVIAHTVGQQTSEIGVRMALGASRSSVLALFLRQALGMVTLGVAAGLAGASSLTSVLRTLASGIGTNDPWVFVLAPALMFAVATAAALRPALRAAGVDPASALRAE
jgi:ABC-type antimicrobial peptide transport system permease subunit